jgi:CheY-like chemotaxis protein
MTAVAVAKLRILVVDDEPAVGNTVKMLLQFEGHEVEATHSSKEALALFEIGRFDLVFTDYAMPGMKGDQLAAAIKTRAPDQPVVMITGHAGTFTPSPSVDFVVAKPFRLEHLREAITRVLSERSGAVGGKRTPLARARNPNPEDRNARPELNRETRERGL